MSSLPPLFDATKYFGLGSNEQPDFTTAGQLLEHLDRLGIARALCWHVISRDQAPMRGNRMLLAEIADTPGAKGRLIPAFTIGPAMQYEPGAVEELKEAMSEHNVRAMRVFRSRWSLLQIEPVVRALRGQQPVVFIDAREGMDARELLDFAQALPTVPLVILHTMWGDHIALLDLMRRCRNIYADTSWMHTEGTITLIARTFGAQRLVFGSGWKAHNGGAITALAHADLTPETRQAIANGNLAHLLSLPDQAPASPPAAEHRLWHAVTGGEPLTLNVVDAHGHLGELGMWVLDSNDFDAQASRYIRSMDRLGVNMAVLSGEEALFGDPVEGNAYLRDRAKPYGDRFHGYLGFHPLFADTLQPRLDDFFADPFFVGFKVLCDYWGIPVTDPRFTPVWEYANAHRLPILLHTWKGPYNDPAMLKEIAPRYPDASFLLGHSGGSDRTSAEELALANPNVYLEWCGSFCTRQSWEDTLARVGNRQVVYGTDGIFHDPSWELGRLLSLDVPDSTLLPILGDNMREILARRR
ncbi:MAG: amidohydrolase family protein [Armatimonadota bacterium]